MTLPFVFSSAISLFMKLERDLVVLENEVSEDGFFNFVVTGYSLIDWVRNDPSIPATAKTKVAMDSLYANQWLRVCGDLATAAKHFVLTRRVPVTQSAVNTGGFGRGRFGKGRFGIGEPTIEINLDDGSCYDCLELSRNVKEVWTSFFVSRGLISSFESKAENA